MKTHKLSLVNIGLLLAVALVGSFFIVRPITASHSAAVPVFMEEEVYVSKPMAVSQSLPVPKAVSLTQPVPLSPLNAAPLPILPPRITGQILPQYPALALKQNLSGTTLLSIFISKAGAPDKVAVKVSSGIAELDESALKAVSQWQFEPARQGGAAVTSWLEVPVRFALKD